MTSSQNKQWKSASTETVSRSALSIPALKFMRIARQTFQIANTIRGGGGFKGATKGYATQCGEATSGSPINTELVGIHQTQGYQMFCSSVWWTRSGRQQMTRKCKEWINEWISEAWCSTCQKYIAQYNTTQPLHCTAQHCTALYGRYTVQDSTCSNPPHPSGPRCPSDGYDTRDHILWNRLIASPATT